MISDNEPVSQPAPSGKTLINLFVCNSSHLYSTDAEHSFNLSSLYVAIIQSFVHLYDDEK